MQKNQMSPRIKRTTIAKFAPPSPANDSSPAVGFYCVGDGARKMIEFDVSMAVGGFRLFPGEIKRLTATSPPN